MHYALSCGVLALAGWVGLVLGGAGSCLACGFSFWLMGGWVWVVWVRGCGLTVEWIALN